MKEKSTFLARNLPVGSVVELYKEDWISCGLVEIFDGDFDSLRVMLSSLRTPERYTFLSPFVEFIQYHGTFYIKPF